MTFRAYILYIIVFLLTSCSGIHPINHELSKPDHVDLNLKVENNKKSIDELPTIKSEETVRVGESGGEVYVQSSDVTSHEEKVEKKIRLGINLGPGLNRVINYVSVLKVLERHNLAPTIVTGSGMGAVIASMYAEGMTPEAIEWHFYKYFKENETLKPFEKEWLEKVDQILLSVFKNKKIEDTKKKLFISLYSSSEKKTYYFDHGNIRELLLKGLKLESREKYSAVFEKEVFNGKLLTQMGADFTLGIDGLGNKFDFDRPNEYLFGVYGRTIGRIRKEKISFDFMISLPLSKMNLDAHLDLPLWMKKSYEHMNKELPNLKNKIQTKLELK